MSLDESVGEAAWQFLFQWLFYLGLVSALVKSGGPTAATEITFNNLVLSSNCLPKSWAAEGFSSIMC